MARPVRPLAVTLAAALLALTALTAAAQAPTNTYRIGEKVEVRPNPARDAWEPGVVTDFAYDIGLPIVRYSANERAFDDKDVRHLPAAPAAAPGPLSAPTSAPASKPAPESASARRATLLVMTSATPPDDGPVPATPRH